MKRAVTLISATGLIAVGVIAALIFLDGDDDGVVAANKTTEPREINTAVAARKDFVEDTEVEGTLGFGPVENLPNLATGVVTSVPEAGAVMELGDVLFEIDGRPVLLLEGDTPMYRAFNSHTADGADVLRLEEMLLDLGHATESNLNVDGDFTSATSDAIERWQESLGLEPTGEIPLGYIVYRPEGFRVSVVHASLGQQIQGGSILSYTSTERVVTVLLDTSLTGLLFEGQVIEVELPDDSVVDGTVTFVSDVAVTEGQGPNATSYIEVEILLDGSGAGFDESPVTVRVEETLEEAATVVPIAALVALAEGGYAVERVADDGSTSLVGVALGTFLDNEVSIRGAIEPGDRVVIP